jgi:hypothetical protein
VCYFSFVSSIITLLKVIGVLLLPTLVVVVVVVVVIVEYAVAQFVQALRYKPEGRWFDSR